MRHRRRIGEPVRQMGAHARHSHTEAIRQMSKGQAQRVPRSNAIDGARGKLITSLAPSPQQIFQRAAVDVFQRLDAGNVDMLVNLVDAGVQWAEFDYLVANLRNEAAV